MKPVLAVAGAGLVLAVACSAAGLPTTGLPEPSTPAVTAAPTATAAPTSAATALPARTAATAIPTAAPTARPAYLTIALTDVRTGERFTLGGFPGKVAIVQGMAVW